MIYLDNAATTHVSSKIRESIEEGFKFFWANPSSGHEPGRAARNVIEECRRTVAQYINAHPTEIIFTSGGTEANNLAIQGFVEQCNDDIQVDRDIIITTEIEHDSVYKTCQEMNGRGTAITFVPVHTDGVIDLECFKDILDEFYDERDRILVSIMYVNNETGTIQPIKEISDICKNYPGVILHVDAVQAFAHIPLNMNDLDGVDMLSVSGHKFGAPKGSGFLYVRDGIEIKPLLYGGHQERGFRAGTENLPYIYALAKRILELQERDMIGENKIGLPMTGQYIWNKIKQDCSSICKVTLNGSEEEAKHNWHIINVTFEDIDAYALITMLSDRGIYVSAGAACNSGSKTPSRVLLAMGVSPEDAMSTIRISTCDDTTLGECNEFIEKLINCLNFLKTLE